MFDLWILILISSANPDPRIVFVDFIAIEIWFAAWARDCVGRLPQNLPSLLDPDRVDDLKLYIVEDDFTDCTRDIILCLAENDSRIVPVLSQSHVGYSQLEKLAFLLAGWAVEACSFRDFWSALLPGVLGYRPWSFVFCWIFFGVLPVVARRAYSVFKGIEKASQYLVTLLLWVRQLSFFESDKPSATNIEMVLIDYDLISR